MSPIAIASRTTIAAAALALLAIPATANAQTTWTVAHPPYTAVDNVPYAPLNAISAISPSNVLSLIHI